MRSRVEAALACGEQMGEAEFMPTGGQGRYGPPEAEVISDLLRARGISPDRIRPVPAGVNTIRSTLACAQALRGQRVPVCVATSAYHLPRCVLLLRLAGVPARSCRPAPVPASTRRLKRWFWRLRELAAVPVDALVMLSLRLGGRL